MDNEKRQAKILADEDSQLMRELHSAIGAFQKRNERLQIGQETSLILLRSIFINS